MRPVLTSGRGTSARSLFILLFQSSVSFTTSRRGCASCSPWPPLSPNAGSALVTRSRTLANALLVNSYYVTSCLWSSIESPRQDERVRILSGAANESVAHPPTRPASTSGTDEAFRPAQTLKVGVARSIAREPGEQLTPALRIVDTGPRMQHELRLFSTKDSKGNSPLLQSA